MKGRFLILLYVAVLAAPLVLGWATGWPARSLRDELASGAGMLAFTVILVEFVLSGRFRTVSSRIGMDVTMRVHQLFARTGLALAVLHPFLYAAPFDAQRVWDVTRAETLSLDMLGLLSGALAFVLLPTLVFMSIGRTGLGFKYETWRLLHGLGAVAIAGAVFVHATQSGRYAQSPYLFWFWAAMCGLAALSLAYVYLFEPLEDLRTPWRVTRIRRAAERTWDVAIAPDGHKGLDYDAGQFVWLNLGHGAWSLHENPFSLASSRAAGDELEFVIKELGDTTGQVGQVPVGTRAYVDGPHGTLSIKGRTEPGIALIAGGVGIAPMLGLLKDLHARGDTRPTVLIYGNRTSDQIVLRDEMEALASAQGTELIHILSEPGPDWKGRTGFLDPAAVHEIFDTEERRKWLYVLCGPPPMLDAVEAELMAIGIPATAILSERFVYD